MKLKEKSKAIFNYFSKPNVPAMIYGIIILLGLFFVVFVGMTYMHDGSAGTVLGKIISKKFSLPAVVVNYVNFIAIKEVQSDMDALRSFYENQDFSSVGMRVDFSTSDGEKRLKIIEKKLLNKLIEDKAIFLLANKRGIKISQNDLENAVDKKLEEYNIGDDVEKDLRKRYGWTINEFKEKIVLPNMYQEALYDSVADELASQSIESKEKIEMIQKELVGGRDFSEVAIEYSEGASSSEGGELGWMSSEQFLPEISNRLFSDGLEKNEIIQSRLGYHVFYIEDRKKEGDKDVIKSKHIFVKTKNFADWLGEQMKNMDIYIPAKGFYWDNNEVGVQFSSQEMRDFESAAMENVDGDASLFF